MFSKSQLVIVLAVFLIILFFVLVFFGLIPGLRPDIGTKTELSVWGVYISEEELSSGIKSFQETYPNVTVKYEEKNPVTYESDLINALALGSGPDVVMFHNTWLPKHINKIYPAPEEVISLRKLRELFPTVIEQDLTSDEKIFGLPLYIDTLALFYNQDIFDASNISSLPETWEDFLTVVKKLKETDNKGNIKKAGVAIGGSLDSIERAGDLLSLFMLQSGAKMVSDDFSRASFADIVKDKNPGRSALEFYTQFANPSSPSYTWNDSLGKSLNYFSEGKVGAIFNYSHIVKELKNKNPFLNFLVAKMPQLKGSSLPVNYPDYWALTVLNRSIHKEEAWNLVSFLTTNQLVASNFYQISRRPPALRTLLPECQKDNDLAPFCNQTLTARSWSQVDKNKINLSFSEAIKDVVEGHLSAEASLKKAQDKITLLMK